MKKNILIAALFSAFSYTANAQVFQIEKIDGSVIEMDVNSIKEMRFKEDDNEYTNTAPEGLEIVDLGLSVNWASFNLGAKSVDDYGLMLSWGELEQKTWYSWSMYKFGTSASNLTKYNTSDGLMDLQAEDDAATVLWGSDWRMPTRAEWDELIANSRVEYNAKENDVVGVKLWSTVPGYQLTYIFLPANGYIQDGGNVLFQDLAVYWSKSCVNGEISWPQFAFAAHFWNGGEYPETSQISGVYRWVGHPVRAVTERK